MSDNKIFQKQIGIILCLVTMSASANESVRLNLKGKISQKCSIYNLMDSVDLSDVTAKTISFGFYCNSPFDISVSSQNGGLKSGGYLVRYQYSLEIPKAGLNIHGESQKSRAHEKIVNIEKVPFESRGQLRVNLIDQLEMAGHYEETLKINLYPKSLL
ncbi:hypothetical protein [Photobacterium sp. 1_MG-2023]|uniref:hypothetical protein n=1 Tax=Photobacterium sp. 1_MG-2023 TaxID=3062646 RepID=UPI0026E11FA5|nr:hypothetical protein [Photobacterium sp. 1_MG-2023]MDO6708546.1 hypothetical protein [Photobacterium sp. 1_MG-2023]